MKTIRKVSKAMVAVSVTLSAFIVLCVCPLSNVNAQGVGINPSDNGPDPSAGLDIDFTNKGLLIPRVSLTSTTDVSTIVTPATYLTVYNTNAAMTNGNGAGMYYWNDVNWIYMAAASNGPGTSGQVLTSGGPGAVPAWSTPAGNSCSFTIGQSYGGGIIFYVDVSGCHGLIAATSDQSTGIAWSNISGSWSGAVSYANGFSNTNGIIAQGAASGAAYLCYNLSLNGYTDWYLPSRDELAMMYMLKTTIGGFAAANYRSSTEIDDSNALYMSFSGGFTGTNGKSNSTFRVRAIRGF